MQRYLARRVLVSIVTLSAVSVIIFIMARMGGDPRSVMLDEFAGEEIWEELGRELGIDKPIYQQYGIFLKDILTGDYGQSIKERRPVIEVIWERLPATMELAAASFVFSTVIGVPLGILSSVRRGGVLDMIGKLVALVGQSAPSFWLGIMLMFFFAVQLGWFPTGGEEAGLRSLILPAIALGLFELVAIMRLTRSGMIEVMDTDFIRTARAKGLSERVVIGRHAVRHALLPVVTMLGLSLGRLIGGSVIIELVFAWPGIGRLIVDSIVQSDYPMVQASIIVLAASIAVTNLLVDVSYRLIDPRIRAGAA